MVKYLVFNSNDERSEVCSNENEILWAIGNAVEDHYGDNFTESDVENLGIEVYKIRPNMFTVSVNRKEGKVVIKVKKNKKFLKKGLKIAVVDPDGETTIVTDKTGLQYEMDSYLEGDATYFNDITPYTLEPMHFSVDVVSKVTAFRILK